MDADFFAVVVVVVVFAWSSVFELETAARALTLALFFVASTTGDNVT